MNPLRVFVMLICAVAMHAQTQMDSPLVQAAKRTVAARQKATKPPLAVVTDETVVKSTAGLTTGSGGAEIPSFDDNDRSAPPTRAAERPRVSKARQDDIVVPTADDDCLPQPSQNRGDAAPRMAENTRNDAAPPRAQNPSAPQALPNATSDATGPRTAASSAGMPQESQNAGPNRPPVPRDPY